mmetsp:Transcript_4579/g.13651  ORF Transcript_4579/g.13651 Transcript_4579/m.13651 type:complete len:97 (-) Transcript_4579:218-508(-)
MNGNVSAALHFLHRAVDLTPHNPDILSDLGVALWLDKQIERSFEVLHKARRLAPDHRGANKNLETFQRRLLLQQQQQHQNRGQGQELAEKAEKQRP